MVGQFMVPEFMEQEIRSESEASTVGEAGLRMAYQSPVSSPGAPTWCLLTYPPPFSCE
jgi:hypothetical protein